MRNRPASHRRRLVSWRPEVLDRLEIRLAPAAGSITGFQWEDLDVDRIVDAGEPPLAGWTVYLDGNNNGQLDSGEAATTTDASGAYRFDNLPPGPYTVATISSAGYDESSPGLAIPSGQGALLPLANRRALVFDDARRQLDITASNGQVQRFDVASGTLLSPLTIGGVPAGADITPDGRFLYVADTQTTSTQGFVRKVDLATGAVTLLAYDREFLELGAWNVQIGQDGRGLVTSTFGGSGWTPLRQLDTSADTLTTRNEVGQVRGTAQVRRAADRSRLLVIEPNITSGPLFTYDAVGDVFSARRETNITLSSTVAAVNRDGSLIALEMFGSPGPEGLAIFDRDGRAVTFLKGQDGGAIFDPVRDILYSANATADQIVAFDTRNWSELYRIAIGENVGTSDNLLGNGEMAISGDGRSLFLSTPSGIRVFRTASPGASLVELADGQVATGVNFGSYRRITPSITINDVTVVEGNSGTTSAVFHVTLSTASNLPVEVDFLTADDSATLGLTGSAGDATPVSGRLTFAPGETSKTITVSVTGDTRDEPDEKFLVNLRNPSNATIADGQGVGMISNDDAPARSSISGVKFNDLNGNGGREAGEPGLPGWTMYLDLNNDGQLGPGEPSTLTAADGSYAITNIPQGTYTLAEVPQAGWRQTRPGTSISPYGNNLNVLIADPARRAIIPDSQRNLLYITTGSGVLDRYDVATRSFLTPWTIGTVLNGADITPDGRYLYVAEGQRNALQGVVHKVDLDTGNVTEITYDLGFYESGSWDIAIGADGRGLLTTRNISLSPSTAPLRVLDTATDTLTIRTDRRGGNYGGRVTGDSRVARGSGRDLIALAEPASADLGPLGPLSTFDTANDVFPVGVRTTTSLRDAMVAVNRDGTLIAYETGGANSRAIVRDRNLNLVVMLNGTSDGGLAFDPTRDLLYVVNSVDNLIVAYDTNTWTTQFSFAVGEDAPVSASFGSGEMRLSDDGRFLFLSTPAGVRMYRLYAGTIPISLAANQPLSGQNFGAVATTPSSVTISDGRLVEGNTAPQRMAFTVRLSGPSDVPVTVSYATVDGTATASVDYDAASGTLTFAPGQTTRTILVPLRGDTLYEPNEAFTLTLSGASGATLTRGQATGTIVDDEPVPAFSIKDANGFEPDTGTAVATFTVTLSSQSIQPVTVSYATVDGIAIAGVDYDATAGTLTFAPGETSKVISVPIIGDTSAELTETFTVNLSNPSLYTIVDGLGVGTIFDFDPAPAASISDASATEGNAGTVNAVFTVSLSAMAGQTITVNWSTADASARSPGDYGAASGTLTFAPGEQQKTITVVVNDDLLDEDDENFLVNLSGGAGLSIGRGQGVGTIVDDDALPTLAIGDVAVTEGNTGTTLATFTVSLSAASGRTVAVDYVTADGTASADSDYIATAGSLVFAPGQTTRTVTVAINADTAAEPDETFLLNLAGTTNATPADGQGQATILNDDTADVFKFSAAIYSIVEGGGSAKINVTRSGAGAGTVTVDYATADGAANAGLDYASASGTLTFAPGELAKTFTIPILDDGIDERDEIATMTLSAPTGGGTLGSQATAWLTILDDDPTPAITIGDATVTEGDSGTVAAVFTVRLSNPSWQPVVVGFATASNDASDFAGDFAAANGTLTFAPGETQKTITVLVNGDTLDEADETFLVNLSGAVNAQIGDRQGLGTILDDDPTPTLSVSRPSVLEGNSGSVPLVFTVSLSAPSGRTVRVDYSTVDSTAKAPDDYQAVSGTLTFLPGEASKQVTVLVNGDTLPEADELLPLRIENALNAVIPYTLGIGTIVDDDPKPSFAIAGATVTEGGNGTSFALFTVTLSMASGETVALGYSTFDGSASVGADYMSTTGTLTFAPGVTQQTIAVPVLGDTLDEVDESFIVMFTSWGAATPGNRSATGTIVDDDPSPTLTVNDATVTEGNAGTAGALFTVSLSAPSGRVVSVSYATAGGTATAGSDYDASSGVLTFAPGETSKTVGVAVRGDAIHEADETFFLNLSGPTNATLADAEGLGTIMDDDPAVLSLAVSPSTVPENAGTGAVTGTITRSDASDLSVALTVALTSSDPTEVTVPVTVVIPAGQSSAAFQIAAVDDFLLDGTQVVTLTASATGFPDAQTSLGVTDNEVAFNGLALDFGTAASPIAAGYTRATSATTYTTARGYGWLGGAVQDVDRGASSKSTDLTRDFALTALATFGVRVPAGTYDVTLIMGDARGAHESMGVFLEGTRVDTVSTSRGKFATTTYRVTVNDGQLILLLDDLGGRDANVVLNALKVATVSLAGEASLASQSFTGSAPSRAVAGAAIAGSPVDLGPSAVSVRLQAASRPRSSSHASVPRPHPFPFHPPFQLRRSPRSLLAADYRGRLKLVHGLRTSVP